MTTPEQTIFELTQFIADFKAKQLTTLQYLHFSNQKLEQFHSIIKELQEENIRLYNENKNLRGNVYENEPLVPVSMDDH